MILRFVLAFAYNKRHHKVFVVLKLVKYALYFFVLRCTIGSPLFSLIRSQFSFMHKKQREIAGSRC